MKKFLFLAIAALLLVGCRMESLQTHQEVSTVHFLFDAGSGKSLSVNETYISNCNILAYDASGSLVAAQYSATGPVTALSFSCSGAAQYKFYCICNIGDITAEEAFESETSLVNYQYSVSSYSGIIDQNGAVPMTGSTDLMTISDGMNIVINLTRCVALVTIRIDDSRLDYSSLDFVSVRLKNAPKKVGLFSSSAALSAADCSAGNDSADSGELQSFNTGEAIGFYMFENAQGELLPTNTSCRSKFFNSGSLYENICSYIELEGTYDDSLSSNPRHGTFTYRFYLGGNPTTDFSVLRNHHYYIVLEVNDDGVDEQSWRVDSDLTPYATAVVVDPEQYTFPNPSGNCTLSATVLPAGACQQVVWSSSDESVARVDSEGCVTAVAEGQAIIKATATDGSGVFDTCRITVLRGGQPIRIRPNYLDEDGWVLGCGSSVNDFEVTVTYDNGAIRTLTGSDALAAIDNIDGEWIISGDSLSAPDYDTPLELLLLWTDPESGRTLSFSSEGEVVAAEDIYTLTYAGNVAKKYGDGNDCPTLVGSISCYCSQLTDLSGRARVAWDNSLVQYSSGRYCLVGSATVNGSIYYSITGSFTDDFNNPVSKTVNCMSTIFEWRKYYYNVEINTEVREHIDASFGSQEQADNIIVTVTLVKSWTGDLLIAQYFYPASYDEYGDLVQGYFSYSWYNRTLTVQMQDVREYQFSYDDNGDILKEGFWYEDGRYIYYEPLNN